MKKIFIIPVILMLFFFTASISFAAGPAALPEIDGWTNGPLRTTVLDTVSGNKGTWLERDYRTSGGITLHAVWIEGAGDKGWDVSDKTISADAGALGAGTAYKTLTISGEKAILEFHPVTGRSLAVKIGKIGTLTLESKYAEEDEIIRAAETIVNGMK